MISAEGQSRLRSKDGPLLNFESNGNVLFCSPPLGESVHPWYTSLTWADAISAGSGKIKKTCRPAGYYATIEPGFVNGLDPYIDSQIVYPLSIAVPPGRVTPESSYAFGTKTKGPPDSRAPGLLERPRVWISNGAFMNIAAAGTGVSMGEQAFFEQHGFDRFQARGEPQGEAQGEARGDERESPWVGYCDVFLSTARMSSVVAKPELGGFPVTAISYSASYKDTTLQLYGSRTRLMLGQIPSKPTRESQAAMTVLGMPYEDDGQDYIRISRIFVLKYGADAAAYNVDFDGTEWVFVKHFCFWNLQYMPKIRDPVNMPSSNISLAFLPLIGRYSIAPVFAASAIESALNAAIAGAMNAASNEGKYWTT